MLSKLELLERALLLAVQAHQGQTDKQGVPYIFHPLRVMNTCQTLDCKIVGILHDVIEDTYITEHNLLVAEFPAYLVDAVVCMTKTKDEKYEDFIGRILDNKIAVEVKIADIKDNLNTARLDEVTPKDMDRMNVYIQSLQRLQAVSTL